MTVKYETKYVLLSEVVKHFDSESDLLCALCEGAFKAYGRKFTSDDAALIDDDFPQDDVSELEEISCHTWEVSSPNIEKNQISKFWQMRAGSDFYYYNDIKVIRADLDAFLQKHIVASPASGGLKPVSVVRVHYTPYQVGRAYLDFKKDRKVEPSALDLWGYIESNLRHYGFDDVIPIHGSTQKPAFSFYKDGSEKHLTFRNFENTLSDYKTGKKIATA